MSELDPHLLLEFDRSSHRLKFFVESANEQFRIHTSYAELAQLPEVQATLCREALFVKEGETLRRLVPRADIHSVLRQVGRTLAKLPTAS